LGFAGGGWIAVVAWLWIVCLGGEESGGGMAPAAPVFAAEAAPTEGAGLLIV